MSPISTFNCGTRLSGKEFHLRYVKPQPFAIAKELLQRDVSHGRPLSPRGTVLFLVAPMPREFLALVYGVSLSRQFQRSRLAL